MRNSIILFTSALMFAFLAGFTDNCSAQSAEQLFQQGLMKEEGEGLLEEAIAIYQTVVENVSASRALRASALLHIGQCYEKLGRENAKEAYEKLISDFADQKDLVEISRQKLSAMIQIAEKSSPTGIVFEELWPAAEDVYGASPDGRYLNFINWKTIELAVKDLQTGKTWELTNKGTWKPPMQFPDQSVWSPDSRQLAYYWFNGDTAELHTIYIDGSGDRVICKDKGNNAPWPIDWTPDGKFILAFRDSRKTPDDISTNGHVVLVSVNDGSVKELEKLTGLQPGGTGSISPDNKYYVYDIQQSEESENNDIMIGSMDGTYQQKIVADAADDGSPVWSTEGDRILFVSDRLGTNDLWSLELSEGKAVGTPRIEMSNLGNTELFRITNDEELYYYSSHFRTDIFKTRLNLKTGEILMYPERISVIEDEMNFNPVWSHDGRYIVYQIRPEFYDQDIGRRFILVVHDTRTGENKKFITDFYGAVGNYWNKPRWSNDSRHLILDAKYPGGKTEGFYLFDVTTGNHKDLYVKDFATMDENSNIGYFPIITSDGNDIIFISPDRKAIIRRNIDSGQEKYIWSGEDELLYYCLSPNEDEIVYGHFFNNRNALYLVKESDRSVTKLADFDRGVTPYTISWTPDGSDILFEKGAYGEGQHSIWRISKDGGDAEKVMDLGDFFSQGEVRTIELHSDGEQVVFDLSSGKLSEVWSMKNLFRK